MEILSGWKEIAAYLLQAVRTVQRWESLGMPVHRPKGRWRTHVVAIPQELDQWLSSTPTRNSNVAINSAVPHEELLERIRQLETENANLRKQLSEGLRRIPPNRIAAKFTGLTKPST